jgi:hypothetical protein
MSRAHLTFVFVVDLAVPLDGDEPQELSVFAVQLRRQTLELSAQTQHPFGFA